MDKFSDVAQSIDVYRGLAQAVFPNGSEIRCLKCEISRQCSVEEIALWTRQGFPRCKKCGSLTDLVNPYRKES